MEFVIVLVMICSIIMGLTTIEFSNVEVNENVEVNVDLETANEVYDRFLVESLTRRILTIIDDNVIIENKPRVLVDLLSELQTVHDTSDLLDEHPKIHKIIFHH